MASTRIYSYLLKRKIIAYLMFFLLSIALFFASIYLSHMPAIVTFLSFCALCGLINFSGFVYKLYIQKVSALNDKDFEEERTGFYLIAGLSFPIIFFTGLLMSLFLSGPTWDTGFGQIYLLLSLFIILNEIFMMYKAIRTITTARTPATDQKSAGFALLLISENISIIIFLFTLAWKFDFPSNIFALMSTLVFVASFAYLYFRMTRAAQHTD